jgi:hypothetical protein
MAWCPKIDDPVVKQRLHSIHAPGEQRATETGHDPDHDRQNQPATEVVKIDSGRELRDLVDPVFREE